MGLEEGQRIDPPGDAPNRSQGPPSSKPPHIFTLGISTFLMVTGMTMLVPATPLLRAEYSITNTQVGVVIGMFSIGRLMFDMPGGRFSDRWGFRAAASVGIVVSSLGAVLAASAPSFEFLLGSRAIQGIGSALYTTAAMGLVIALSPEGRIGWAVSVYQGILLVGLAVGPTLGGFVTEWYGLAGCFYGYAVMGVIALVFLAFSDPGKRTRVRKIQRRSGRVSKRRDDETQASPGGLRRLFGTPGLLWALFATYTIFWVRAGVRNTLLPLFMDSSLHMDEVLIGSLTGVVAVSNIFALIHVGRAIDRRGRRPFVVWGLGATAVSILLFAFLTESWMLIPAGVLLGVATGYAGTAPAAVVADLAAPAMRGTAMGIHRMAIDLGFLTGPIVIGGFIDVLGHRWSFVVSAALIAAVAVASRSMPETLKSHPKSARS